MNEHPANEVIAELLRKEDIGTSPKRKNAPWPTIDTSKDLPNREEAIFVTPTQQPTEGRLQKTGETQGLESFQVRVRAKSQPDAHKKIQEIADKFDSIKKYKLSVGTKYYMVFGIHRTTSPVYIGEDDNHRENFTLNCITCVREVQS